MIDRTFDQSGDKTDRRAGFNQSNIDRHDLTNGKQEQRLKVVMEVNLVVLWTDFREKEEGRMKRKGRKESRTLV